MVEAQAAARVDRMDQKKDIIIYRYIVQDSIEEVLSLLAAPPLFVY
jgi:SNF2 family DNA or RNA helicase